MAAYALIADIPLSCRVAEVNVQIIAGASNATYSLLQATGEDLAQSFPVGAARKHIEDLIDRLGDEDASRVLAPLSTRSSDSARRPACTHALP